MQKLNENKDICIIPKSKCGYLNNGFCTYDNRCAYKLSEQYFKPYTKNEKSTVETIREIEKKHDKILTQKEILVITPNTEILNEKGLTFIIDEKGNILNLKNRNQIYRNFK